MGQILLSPFLFVSPLSTGRITVFVIYAHIFRLSLSMNIKITSSWQTSSSKDELFLVFQSSLAVRCMASLGDFVAELILISRLLFSGKVPFVIVLQQSSRQKVQRKKIATAHRTLVTKKNQTHHGFPNLKLVMFLADEK